MLSSSDNELLTRVGPGTPMGQLFRQYWLPVLLSSELPERDGPPLRVRMLGEDLLAFRDTQGSVGLLGENCPHRGASLFFGRNEEAGLRCVYHGWKYDVTGRCVDMPNEPPESNFRDKVRHTAYPCREAAGVVWTYMGSRTPPPSAARRRAGPRAGVSPRRRQDHRGLQLAPDSRGRPRLGPHGVPAQPARHRLGWSRATPVERPSSAHRGGLDRVRPREGGTAQARRRSGLLAHLSVPAARDGDAAGHRRHDPLSHDRPDRRRPHEFLERRVQPGAALDRRRARPAPGQPRHGRIRPRNERPVEPVAARRQSREQLPPRPRGAADPTLLRHSARQAAGHRHDGEHGDVMDRANEHLGTSDAAIIQMRRRILETARALGDGVTPPGVEDPSIFRVRSATAIMARDTAWLDEVRELLQARPGHAILSVPRPR